MGWTDAVWALVQRLPRVFSLEDVYRLKHEVAKRYPKNHHIEAKIRQQLQVLRDEGRIQFIDNRGTYRRVD